MTRRLVLVIAVAVNLALGCMKPEETLKEHAEAVSKLLDEHKDRPKEGLDKVRTYLRDNLGQILEAIAKVAVEIDASETPARRAERIMALRVAIEVPFTALTASIRAFEKSAGKDRDAKIWVKKLAETYEGMARRFGGLAASNVFLSRSDRTAIRLAGEMSDKVCACRDLGCIESTLKEYEDRIDYIDKKAKLRKEDEDRLFKKMKKCMNKLTGTAISR